MLIHRLLDRLFNKREIVNCDRDVYLHRWYVIRTAAFGLFIHKFVRSDEDRALHDHPWPFIVIPIWRRYIEHSDCNVGCDKRCETMGGSHAHCIVPVERRVLPILGTRYRPATYRHRVELFERPVSEHTFAICGKINPALPAWSIFIRFRAVREWGFWFPTGWQHWRKWWQDKCE